jgi:hypothetical protein
MRKYVYLIFTIILAALIAGCAAKDMTLSNKGYEALSDANYADAEKYLSEALYENPDNPYALLNLGRVYQEMGYDERARQMYEKVIALDPPDSARQATSESGEEKPLVEIARENLELLEAHSQTAESKPAPVEKPAPAVISLMPLQKEMFSEEEEGEEEPLKETKTAASTNNGYYRVREGDTLFTIAGRKDVYNNPLKWPTLYRLNMKILEDMKVTDDFEYEKVAEGLDLKLVTPAEASENLMKLGEKLWVINALSVLEMKFVVPTAVRLMKRGYHVYLTRATVKGKEWIRLRIGFYDNESEANDVREKIVSDMDKTGDSWVTKISMNELEEYGGY